MPYIGQDLQVAYPSYTNIDDISGSFNGVTTSFPLTVGGAAPVPAPLSSNQCLISVDGVVQRPDDTGTEGFRLSGGNIIFSSAPSIADDFFGIILAGADYVNVGANFPDGTLGAPSITFDQDNDTGYYRSGSGSVSFASNGVAAGTWSSAGLTTPAFIPTGSSIPTNGVYLPAANNVGVATNGVERLKWGTSEAVFNDAGNDYDFRVEGDTNTHLLFADASTERFGINQSAPATKLDVDGNFGQNIVAVGALDIDCSVGNYFTKTISANSTFTISNVPASRSYGFTLELTHTSGTVTWPASVKFPGDVAPTLTTGKTHLFMFVTDDDGTRWRGAALVDYTN